MTFYVGKSLANGPIRFGVSPRSEIDAIDDDPSLSTGAGGEFLKKRTTGFYYGDAPQLGEPTLPPAPSISATPFWASLKPDGTPRGYAFLGMMGFGTFLVLWGLLVVGRLGPQGWVVVALGLGLIITPIFLTAHRRQQMREQEERERAAREEKLKRERQMLLSYIGSLEKLRHDPSEQRMEDVAFERRGIELPYEGWAPHGRHTVLRIGFNELAKVGPRRAAEVNQLMTRVSQAVGLTAEDEFKVKLDLYRVLVWHLLADDRLGEAQAAELLAFRKGFDIWDRDVPVEAKSADEFKRLRGITPTNLPRRGCPRKLNFHEYCAFSGRGSAMVQKKGKWVARETGALYVTNKRVIFDGRRTIEIPLPKIDDVEVDIDANVLTIKTGGGVKPLTVQVEEPIYAAALIDMASNLNERPKGFA